MTQEAEARGHRAGPALSLETGWDFSKEIDRLAAKSWVRKHKPFFLMIAFPCGPWSPLQRLNAAKDLPERQELGRKLIEFSIELAIIQLEGKRHFAFENPVPSGCWFLPEMIKFIEENFIHLAKFDQCRFNLRSALCNLHKKATMIATSSPELKDSLDGIRCLRDHLHQPVMGGSKITQPAGHYPKELAQAILRGVEREFDKQFKSQSAHVALAAEAEDEADDTAVEASGPFGFESSGSDEDDHRLDLADPSRKIPAGVKMAVKRLHDSTGHRSNRRLARALVLSGAPPEVVQAAKTHRCSVCDERRAPKHQKPASLPTPKDVSDQVHCDVFEAYDSQGVRSYVVHAVDFASRYQMAECLEDKSAESMVKFFKMRWIPVMGAPRVLVADQGREFVAWRFEEMCAEHGILLWHTAIQAPFQNGICERSGGILKTLIAAIVKSQSVIGKDEMAMAVQEAVGCYNQDINELGVSPCQAALGRQPRLQGDVLAGNSIAEHDLLDNKPSLIRQIALRECGKVAMARLHYSQGLRRALVSQSRTTTLTQELYPGQVVYYFRFSKYNAKTEPSRRKLSLRRWHGPALLVTFDGSNSVFVSHRGQLSKCAREHVRPASAMEQVAAGVWRDAIEDVVDAAVRDVTARGIPQELQPQQEEAPAAILDEDEAETPQLEDHVFAHPLQPRELVQAAAAVPSRFGSAAPSTPASAMSSLPRTGIPAPGTPVGDLLRPSGRMDNALRRARVLGGHSSPPGSPVHDMVDPQTGQKRSAEVSLEQLQESTTGEEVPVPKFAGPSFETMETQLEGGHPLRELCRLVEQDRMNPADAEAQDHGTWKGKWPLPSRSQWQAVNAVKGNWPTGEHDAMAAQTARKEYKWKDIPMKDRPAYVEAAKTGWQVWMDNDALTVLDDAEAAATWKRLRLSGDLHKVLAPRYVYTDKNDGLRTETVVLPLGVNARLVVPGYKDVTAYEVRKDAPTGARTSQHLLLLFTSSKGWVLYSADIKSAFLKGEEFAPGERELYITFIKGTMEGEPNLPLGKGGLARLRKGIFGLADSPRRWYLRLHKSLCKLGWVRSEIDAALWFLWSPDHTELYGMVLSHVDDLLVGGNDIAKASIDKLGAELGFGSLETGEFTYCGKTIKQHPDGSISVSMKAYHENLSAARVPLERRRTPDAALSPSEQRSLRGVLGSLQWLVAQVRVDMSYPLSVLQGETPTVGTLLKANALVKKFKANPDFALWFRPMKLDGCGLVGISDASLGNVMKSGGAGQDPMLRVYSQSGYLMMVGDAGLLAGREGKFVLLDGRSHRLSRVCRSTYAAELLSAEETFDTGQYCRGVLAEALGYPMNQRDVSMSCEAVPLTVVVDGQINVGYSQLWFAEISGLHSGMAPQFVASPWVLHPLGLNREYAG